MRYSKTAKMASAAAAMAAIITVGATPAIASADAHIVNASATASYGDQWDDGEPAGGTGIDPGPQTEPDVPGIPDQADLSDLSNIGERAGGTGVDPGPAAPPDTPSGPGLADGGEPAGAIG